MKKYLGLKATQRAIVSELLSIAKLTPDNRTVVIARARRILEGSKPWSLPDKEIVAALNEYGPEPAPEEA